MASAITRPKLEDAVETAVRDLPASATPAEVAKRVTTDPAIAPALQPVRWFKSQAIVGAILAGLGALVAAAPQLTPIVEELASPDQVRWWNAAITIVGVLMGAIGAPVAVSGRVNTTRPIG